MFFTSFQEENYDFFKNLSNSVRIIAKFHALGQGSATNGPRAGSGPPSNSVFYVINLPFLQLSGVVYL